jgi:hypothetical protein
MPVPPPTSDHPDGAIQILALLRREGRLIDFLMEDLTAYSDLQIGAGVRDVHSGCRSRIHSLRHARADPPWKEGEQTTVRRLSTRRRSLVGNVTGHPFPGTLLHAAGKPRRSSLPLGARAGRRIVAQAEVEVA